MRPIRVRETFKTVGGGRENSISILEATSYIEGLTGKKIDWRYEDQARKGDHICYISNLGKFKKHYPEWQITRSVGSILEEMTSFEARSHNSSHEERMSARPGM